REDSPSHVVCPLHCSHRTLHSFPTRRSSDLKKHGFNLPSGKAELWLRLAHDLTGEALPFFVEPPLFSPDGELAKEYPLLCTTRRDRKSTRLNSSHVKISYAGFCLKKKKQAST